MVAELKIGVLTSGGDAPGMNAAVRAVVRGALAQGAQPFAILDGWQGAIDGGPSIREMHWSDVSTILHKGGTVIGTARSADFRQRHGMKAAARSLLAHGIDRIVVIGGDGSLSGADEFKGLWASLLAELVAEGAISPERAAAHPELFIVGLVGSIDNDLRGTDTTIGTDTALSRIQDAIDQISSTAASHQRTFILEVMGRNCGYLALMSAVAGGCDYVCIPESPPEDGWEEEMITRLEIGRKAGRRESLIIVAEGAKDRHGASIDAARVKEALKQKGEIEARITILGHVQRGGTPSAFDRWMSTVLGVAAVQELLEAAPGTPATILGVRHNRVARLPLVEAVAKTRAVRDLVAEGRYQEAVAARGTGFVTTLSTLDVMTKPPETDVTPQDLGAGKRVAILHAGGLAPGMNAAARAAVRLGLAHGYTMLGVEGGYAGLIEGNVRELSWSEVDSWGNEGGAHLGTRRTLPGMEDFYSISRTIESHQIEAIVAIGGFNAYLGAFSLLNERERFAAFKIPIVCVPASIDNNLPGSELSIGADTSINNSVWALDRVKESAAAARRGFVSETMGRRCGYLAFMSGLAAGAEITYLHEDSVSLAQIARDTSAMRGLFENGRDLFLVVKGEDASDQLNAEFIARAFEEEGHGLFDVRLSTIGHMQQGGQPSSYDRLLAIRLVSYALERLDEQFESGKHRAQYIGYTTEGLTCRPLQGMMEEVDEEFRRPFEQWWMQYREVSSLVSMPGSKLTRRLPIFDVLP